MIKTERKSFTNPELTSSQATAYTEALANLKQDKSVILLGLRGSGKSEIANQITNSQPNTSTYDFEVFEFQKRTIESDQIIINANPNNITSAKRQLPQTQVVIVPGLAPDECRNFIRNQTLQCELTPEELAQLSLGLPLLIDRMNQPGTTKETALLLAASALQDNFITSDPLEIAAKAAPYLQTSIPKEVIKTMGEVRPNSSSNHLYANLLDAYKRQRDLAETGITEENPVFLDQKSVEIYNEFLRSRFTGNSLEIYIPNLTEKQLKNLIDSFYKRSQIPNIPKDVLQLTRLKMVGGDHRNVTFWYKNTAGEETDVTATPSSPKTRVKSFEKFYTPLQKNKALLYIHTRDYAGSSWNPVHVGWAVESKLQQLEIPYVVANFGLEKTYFFNGTEISMLDKPFKS